MPTTLTMPKLSPTMEEGSLVKWHKREGEYVEAGDVLFEVATDKATVEYEAVDEGWLRKQLLAEGETAEVGQPVAIFTAEEGDSIEGYEPEGGKLKEEPAEKTAKESPTQKEERPKTVATSGLGEPPMEPFPPLEGYSFPELRHPADRVLASPLARKEAKMRGLDLASVAGSGPNGRVMERDLGKALPSGEVAFGARERPKTAPGSFTEEGLTPMRKAVGQRLQAAKTFIPHFYVTQEIDPEPMIAARTQLQAYGLKPSYNDFIVRASALALRKHPNINSGFNNQNQTITHYQTVDIAIAVSLEGGLITPIVRHADYKNLGQISVEVKELAGRARRGKLAPEEYQGGSFTISNLGMFSISEFVAVINPPQAAILAIGGITEQPVVRNGIVMPGKSMKVTLSSDHRVVDGVDAAKFLQTLKEYIENPAGLLVG